MLLLQGTKKDHVIAKGPEKAISLCFQLTKQLQLDSLTSFSSEFLAKNNFAPTLKSKLFVGA